MASTSSKALNTRDLMALFGVSHMTLKNWREPREGVEHRKSPLPFNKKERAVTFDPKRVKTWADKNGVEALADPIVYAEQPDTLTPEARLKKAQRAAKTSAKAH